MVSRHLKTIATLATPVALPVERLSGRLCDSNEPAVLVFAGAPETADFVAGVLIEIEGREPVGRLQSPPALRGAAFDGWCEGADLAIAEVPWLWRFSLPANAGFRIPAWVSQEIRAADGATIVLPAALRREVMRHCRREKYSVEFSADAAVIRQFYSEQYRPYVAARFGAGAVVVDEPRFLSVSRGMTLAALHSGNDWIAGMLFRRRGTTLELGWFGSTSVPPRTGASEVLDTLVIDQAVCGGVRRVILGHSRPSLMDGVVRYKSRFGAVIRPTRFPQRVIGFQLKRPSPALAAALNAAQFVALPRGRPEVCEWRIRPPLSGDSRVPSPST